MTKIINKEIFKQEYINYVNKSEELTVLGNYKQNNKVVKEMLKFLRKNKNEIFFDEALNELMNHDMPHIYMSAVNTSLSYNVNVDKAISILEKVSKQENLGIYSQIAKINLNKYYSENN